MTAPDTAVMSVLAQLQEGFERDHKRLGPARALNLYREEIRFLLSHKPADVVADLLGFERWRFREWLETERLA